MQLTHTLAKTLSACGEETVVFCSDDAKIFPEHYKIERYSRIKTLFASSRSVRTVADRIVSYNPRCVIFTDDALPAALVLLAIKRRACCVFSVHDVIPHSGVRTRFLNRLKRSVKMISINKT